MLAIAAAGSYILRPVCIWASVKSVIAGELFYVDSQMSL